MAKKPVTKKAKTSKTAKRGPLLLVATRKGAWIFRGDAARRGWKAEGPLFLGQIINHVVMHPASGTIVATASTGHLGPTMFRSTDLGKSWKEVKRSPAFAKVEGGRTVKRSFWLTAAPETGVWYAGTTPQGLFRSDDDGQSWQAFSGLNDDMTYRSYMGTEQDGTPSGPMLHSIIVDPRDPRHLYFGMSSGGFHETTDGGRSWHALSDGMEVVEGFSADNLAFHDPHCVRLCPSNPDRLYQQNHCGIYRLDRPGTRWERIGRAMPKKMGDVGFPMVVHPRDDKTVWVFPMDGQTVWPRTAIDGKPCAYVTRNAGKTWQRLDAGLPTEQAWWTVKRQAMTADAGDPVGLYLGNSQGEIWMGRDEGKRWSCLARHLPEIFAVEVGAP